MGRFWVCRLFVLDTQKAKGRGRVKQAWCGMVQIVIFEKKKNQKKRKIQVLSQSLFLVQEFMSFIGLISDFA